MPGRLQRQRRVVAVANGPAEDTVVRSRSVNGRLDFWLKGAAGHAPPSVAEEGGIAGQRHRIGSGSSSSEQRPQMATHPSRRR
jgi:hypothetical protein